jgi:hypothetical protein
MRAADLARAVKATPQGKWYETTCPAHDDRRASLNFRDGDRGIAFKCHRGCASKVSMTEKYAHLAPDHLRNEIARTERPAQAVEPLVGTRDTAGDEGAAQVVDFGGSSRGSSVAEQLIRNQ